MAKEKEIKVSFCPKCKSRNVKYVFGLVNLFGVIPTMKCFDCGFTSNVFPVLAITESELKNSVEKMKRKNEKNKNVKGRKK